MDSVSFEHFVCGKCGHQSAKATSTHEALADWNTERAEIVDARSSGSCFVTTTKITSQSQRATLEEIIRNLAPLVGADTMHRETGSLGGVFYEVQAPGFSACESASNTILSLSVEHISVNPPHAFRCATGLSAGIWIDRFIVFHACVPPSFS
ncbi:hypothetical protein C7401_119102 [Paraburkholderia unamae]|uniref:hypothetical protein n=1 Tax=Paraburkholderia unamae TaxID=219649 RepID=UPI000DC3F813|nr:hypothetical protein [Paraburkholderia unamae]RAR56453.1 hypothetical protein C7401_119102 [Paraburkholderia unamae]